MKLLAGDMPRTIGIPEAARRSGMAERTFRRRMHEFNTITDGRLLIRGKPGGRWLIVLAVLDEVAPGRSAKRAATFAELQELEADISNAHRRIEVLDIRTNGQSARIRRTERQLKKQRLAIEALQKGKLAVIESLEHILSPEKERD